jgi:pyruvate carboxylase
MSEIMVRAPFAGYASLIVCAGQEVAAGDPIGTVEAVKMEAAVRSPAAGRVRLALARAEAHVEGGQPLVWVESD